MTVEEKGDNTEGEEE